MNLSIFIFSPVSGSITVIDLLSLRDVCFLFVWISGVSVLLPKLILLRDISATWANYSSRVGIWSFYKYSKCLLSVPAVVIFVTTKLKLCFDGENLIAGVNKQLWTNCKIPINRLQFFWQKLILKHHVFVASVWLFLNIQC